MSATKITTIVLISIILTVVLVSIVNVGTSIFLERPNYEDYCVDDGTICDFRDDEIPKPCIRDCDTDAFNDADKDYNQIRFYIFAGLGFILMLSGLFIPELMVKIIGLSAGGIMVTQGIVFNFSNKIAVFISLITILLILGFFAVRVVKKMK